MEKQDLILVVDDDAMNLKVVEYILKNHYTVNCVKSGAECLNYLKDTIPDLILLDLYMPEMNGFEVLEQIKSDERIKEIPVIFLTADDDKETEVKGFQAGAQDFITKPFIAEIVLQRVNRLVELSCLRKHLEREIKRQTAKAEERQHRMEQMSLQAVQTLANTIDAKDTYTKGHSYRVAEYSVLLAKELGWKEEDVDNLRHAALLHDIGKISVPDSVLNKPSKLTDEEYDVIKSHAAKGGEILQCITAIPGADLVARHHHERYDGKGYPDGLSGEDIPKSARIVAIADAYDAMSSKRIYRKGLSKETIRQELVKGRGTQFEPESVDVFIKMLDEGQLQIEDPSHIEAEPENLDDVTGQLIKTVMETMNSKILSNDVDFLTGLQLRSTAEGQISEAMLDKNGCLAFLDIDNLKKINDTIGHKAGDRVLKLMGETLKKFSDNSIECRLGGDEFLLYMKNVSREDAEARIENIIEYFTKAKNEDATIRQSSLSVGLCMTTPIDVYEDIYNKADKALYYVKQNGKSGYGFYQQENRLRQNYKSVDLEQLIKTLKASGDYAGAMNVEYREFARLYEYLGNLQKRYAHNFNLVMITLDYSDTDTLFIDELETAMDCMELSIKETIRNVDICTRYSSVQYLVILMEAGDNNVKMIIDRIFLRFFKGYEGKMLRPIYSVAKMDIET